MPRPMTNFNEDGYLHGQFLGWCTALLLTLGGPPAMGAEYFEGYSIDGRGPFGRFVGGCIRQIKLRANGRLHTDVAGAGYP